MHRVAGGKEEGAVASARPVGAEEAVSSKDGAGSTCVREGMQHSRREMENVAERKADDASSGFNVSNCQEILRAAMMINDHTRRLMTWGAEGQGYTTQEGLLSRNNTQQSRTLSPSFQDLREGGQKPLKCGDATPVRPEPVRVVVNPSIGASHKQPPAEAEEEMQASATKRQKLPEAVLDGEGRWVASVAGAVPVPVSLEPPQPVAPARKVYVDEEWVRGVVDGLGPVTPQDEAEWKSYLLLQYGARSGSSAPRIVLTDRRRLAQREHECEGESTLSG
ncbi:hypothetical protein T484DRAFT_1863829, partial [Baffinella frigidus]